MYRETLPPPPGCPAPGYPVPVDPGEGASLRRLLRQMGVPPSALARVAYLVRRAHGDGYAAALRQHGLCADAQLELGGVIGRSAEVEGDHRYVLSRWWGDGARAVWCMLNPSTADAYQDDHTVRKAIEFTRRWGFDGLEIVNLFSFRATQAREVARNLEQAHDDRTDQRIREVCADAPLCLVAWGRWGPSDRPWVRARAQSVLGLLDVLGVRIECLGRNGDGSPRHPLMLSYDTLREPFPAEAS